MKSGVLEETWELDNEGVDVLEVVVDSETVVEGHSELDTEIDELLDCDMVDVVVWEGVVVEDTRVDKEGLLVSETVKSGVLEDTWELDNEGVDVLEVVVDSETVVEPQCEADTDHTDVSLVVIVTLTDWVPNVWDAV